MLNLKELFDKLEPKKKEPFDKEKIKQDIEGVILRSEGFSLQEAEVKDDRYYCKVNFKSFDAVIRHNKNGSSCTIYENSDGTKQMRSHDLFKEQHPIQFLEQIIDYLMIVVVTVG